MRDKSRGGGINVTQNPIETGSERHKKPQKPIYKKWWFYLILVLVVFIIYLIRPGRNGGKRIDWSKIVLKEELPKPPSTRGNLSTNTSEKLSVSLMGVKDDQYQKYKDDCSAKGFTIDSVQSSGTYEAYNSKGFKLHLSHSSDGISIDLQAPMTFGEITWPTSTLGKVLPTPKSLKGKISYESDESFQLYISDTSKADYDQYVAECSSRGFNVKYNKGERSYYADNNEGYHVSLTYVGNNIMSVEIHAPKGKDAASSQQSSSEKASDGSQQEQKPQENKTDSTEIRADFKSAMDSYEAFMNKYVDFMKKYKANPSDPKLLANYSKMMSQYAETVNKFGQWKSNGMNDAETAYYIDVQARVSKKLLEVQ